MPDSYRLGWPPGPHPDASGPEAAPCARCGHRADSHLHPGSCSVRTAGGGAAGAAATPGRIRLLPWRLGPARQLAASWPEGPGVQFCLGGRHVMTMPM
jgi:hypothetical protein